MLLFSNTFLSQDSLKNFTSCSSPCLFNATLLLKRWDTLITSSVSASKTSLNFSLTAKRIGSTSLVSGYFLMISKNLRSISSSHISELRMLSCTLTENVFLVIFQKSL